MTLLRRLPPGPPPTAPLPALAGGEHRNRQLLHRFLAGDAAAHELLRADYDQQSVEWSAWCATQPDYTAPLDDALARTTLAAAPGWTLEVGCGTGQGTAVLARYAIAAWASDVSLAMLRRMPAFRGIRPIVADVRALPFRTASLDLIVGLNAVPDVREFDRALRPRGRVLWVSSFRERTPLYVPSDELAARWTGGGGVTATAAHGEWVLLERD